jgi:F0F1-type ATP synthase epsilon subunit
MAETKLTSEETTLLRSVLSKLVIRSRTGELGIAHGKERFISTQLCLRKSEREMLNQIA